MPVAPDAQDLGVHADAVVANQEPQGTRSVLQLDLDPWARAWRMAFSQRLVADPVELVAHRRVQRARRTVDDDAKLGRRVQGELLAHTRERLGQVPRLATFGAEPLHGVAALLDHLPHQLLRAGEHGAGRRGSGTCSTAT